MAARHTGLLALGLLAVLGVGPLHAQSEERLEQPDATFPEGFALVQRVRELSDGRVMVADPLGQILVLADMTAGTADTLGGVGQGPAEYRQPDVVFALAGDSTLLLDLGNARLTVVGPDGGFGETLPVAQGDPMTGLLIVLPRGVDVRGGVYFRPMGGRPGAGVPDSAAIVRLDRGSGGLDTIARVKLPSMKQSTSGGAGNQNVSIMPVPLSPEDAFGVASDGRVVIARSGDYHVEWVHPDGRVVRGAPVEYKPVKIRDADKKDWGESLSNGIRIGVSVNNGERRMSMGRGAGSGDPDLDSFDWPEEKPAFVANGVWVSPEGDAWVERSVSAGEPVHFDIFGADAGLKGSVFLPAGRDLVGFGKGTIYAVHTDDLGLQWLERYRRSDT
jgi:hypothetical protein